MPDIALSLVIDEPGLPDLAGAMSALDAQHAPTDRWEIVLVARAVASAGRARLAEYARFRPNVVVAEPGEDETDAVRGRWVLTLSTRDRIPAGGVQRMLGVLGSADPDRPVVLRAVSNQRCEDDWLFPAEGRATVAGGRALLALAQAAVLLPAGPWRSARAESSTGPYRRFAVAAAVHRQVESVELVGGPPVVIGVGVDGRVGAVGRLRALVALDRESGVPADEGAELVAAELAHQPYVNLSDELVAAAAELASRVRDLPAGPRRTSSPLVELVAQGSVAEAATVVAALASVTWHDLAVEARWHEGTLTLTGTARPAVAADSARLLRAAGLDPERLLADAVPRVGLRSRAATSSHPLATQVEEGGSVSRFRVELDPATVGGAPLPRGAYDVVLEAPGLPGIPQQTLRSPGLELPAVLAGDRLVALRTAEDAESLVLDVGAARRSVLGRLDPTRATVTESVDGSLLVVPPVGLHVWPPGPRTSLAGQVVLGGLAFPASLLFDPPRVECRVSGLPGVLSVQTRFGPGRPSPSGCELEVSPDGVYTLVADAGRADEGVSTLVASAVTPRKKPAGKAGGKARGKATAKRADLQRPKAGPAPRPQTDSPDRGQVERVARAVWRRLPTPVRMPVKGVAQRVLRRVRRGR